MEHSFHRSTIIPLEVLLHIQEIIFNHFRRSWPIKAIIRTTFVYKFCFLNARYYIYIVPGTLGLKNGIISEIAVYSMVECGLHCFSKKFCAGHNFKRNARSNKINCQLTISNDHIFEKSNNAEESDWDFYEAVGKRKVIFLQVFKNILFSVDHGDEDMKEMCECNRM